MAPHAISPVRAESSLESSLSNERQSSSPASVAVNRTMIPSTNPDELHDVICVGFGPASLAIAAAMHDNIEFKHGAFSNANDLAPKIVFLEKQKSFRWHAGMQLPGAKMQISWIKDFATLRNPRSSFTFLNYLWNVGRLVQFSNLGTFLPTRLEYEEYMKWVAAWFDHLVEYSHECVEISPANTHSSKPVQTFTVHSRNLKTGEMEIRRARHVIISCGGRPRIPSCLPQSDSRVIHSSSYLDSLPEVCPSREMPYRFVVLGSGQSAAEIFHDLQSRYPNCSCSLLLRQAVLKPSDDSPFVNETFDPDHVDDVFGTVDDVRGADIENDKSTNYGVVRLELLEAIYHGLYLQRIQHPDPRSRPHKILPYREVISVSGNEDGLAVQIQNSEPLHRRGQGIPTTENMTADVVIAATGYERDIHKVLLAGAEHLVADAGGRPNRWQVRRDYSVIFKPGAVSSNAGIWLQGSNERTHGLSDTLLSILSVRAQEVVDAIFTR